jgi:hypothetical protein
VLHFEPSNVGDDGVGVAEKLVLAGTVLRWDGAFPVPCNAREVVIFLSFLVVGLALAFLPFFVALLEEFALHLVHLTPNTVLMLALFAHACEMFVGGATDGGALPPLLRPGSVWLHLPRPRCRPAAPHHPAGQVGELGAIVAVRRG